MIEVQGYTEKPVRSITYSLLTNGVLADTNGGQVRFVTNEML